MLIFLNDIIAKLPDKVLWQFMTAKYDVKAFLKNDEVHITNFLQTHELLHEKYRELLIELIDVDGRLTEYCEGFLEDYITWDLTDNYQEKHYPLDIGAVFMLENLLKDGDGDPYDCEPSQFGIIVDPSPNSTTTASRRLSKSFSQRIPAFRNCVAYPGHGVQLTEQAWTVAKMWLRDVYMWYNQSPLIQQWSGGKLRKDADSHIEFGNRSFIICYTASTLVNLSGIGVHEQIYDEKSLYSANVGRGIVTGMGQKQKPGKPSLVYRQAGTPYGTGTAFHQDQIDLKKLQNFAPMLCPMGYKKPLCYNCDYFSLTKYRRGELRDLKLLECTAQLKWNKDGTPNYEGCYKRAPDDRVSYKSLDDAFWELGKTVWLQEFMCVTQEYSGSAIPLELIRLITNDTWEPVHASLNPCYVGVDYGKSVKHSSAYTVVGEEPDGTYRNYKTYAFPPGTPYHPNPENKEPSVIEHIISLFDSYPNIKVITCDSMGVGATPTIEGLIPMCKKIGFNNVIAYKTVGSSKEFMGKSQMWFRLIKPAWETGKFKTYLDQRLNAEMRAWQCDFPPTDDARPKFHPSTTGKTQSDDAIMSLLYALWGALNSRVGMARENALVGGISSHEANGVSPFEKAYGSR